MKNNISKNSYIYIFVIIFLTIAMLFCCAFGQNGFAFADERQSQTIVSNDAVDLNSDTIAKGNLTIRDYPTQLHATEARIIVNNYRFELDGIEKDDPIVEIVPKNYFLSVGQKLEIGDEYGYYINTEATNNGNYVSTVLVFDITTNTDLVATTDRVIVKVDPIFQYKYAGLTNNSNKETFQNFNLNYGVLNNSVIVAYPSRMEKDENDFARNVKYEMEDDYYLKDVAFGASLYNEQSLNRGDTGYNVYNDYGSYFTGFDYEYQGKYREYGEFKIEDLMSPIFNTFTCLIGAEKAVKMIKGAKQIGKLFSVASVVSDWVDFGVGLYNDIVGEIKTAEKKITATCFYQNRDDQLKYYVDGDNQPFLVKNAVVGVNTTAEQSIWYGVGDSVSAYFNIGHSALNGKTPNYTRFTDQLGVKIVSSKDDTVVTAGDTIIHDSLREVETKELACFEDGDVYMLPNGQDHLVYKDLIYAGDYNIQVDLSDNAVVTVNGESKTGKNLIFNTHANKHDDISIDLQGNTTGLTGKVSISVGNSTSIGSVSPGDDYILKVQPSGVKKLSIDNPDLIIDGIYTYENDTFTPYESFVPFKEGNKVTYPFEDGIEYYIVIRNDGSQTISNASLLIEDVINFEPEQEIVVTADTRAFSFVNTYPTEMSFQLVLQKPNNTDGLTVFNESGRSIASTTIDPSGENKYYFGLAANEKCYVFCSISDTVSFKILPNELYVKWEINGIIDNVNYNIELPRGATYTLCPVYYKDGNRFEISTLYNISNREEYFTYESNVLTITYNVPYEYEITIIPVTYPGATLRITPTKGREDIDYTVTFDKTGGSGGSDSVTANYNRNMKTAEKPSRTGYTFKGYYAQSGGYGKEYYDSNMQSSAKWEREENGTIYAYWQPNQYTVTFNQNGGSGGTTSTTATYGEKMPFIKLPERTGYNFLGYYTTPSGGTRYYQFYDSYYNQDMYYGTRAFFCDFARNITLYARWEEMSWTVSVQFYVIDEGYIYSLDTSSYVYKTIDLTYGAEGKYYISLINNHDYINWELLSGAMILDSGTGRTVDLKNKCRSNYSDYILKINYRFNPKLYSKHGIEIYIMYKVPGIWKFGITNKTGKSQTFYYNTKMCFDGDAQNWINLNDVSSFTLNNNSFKGVTISENAMATTIAISYMDGIYRKVLYANNLNPNDCTMNVMESTIDTTAPPQECLAAGTLITLADGRQVPVETLTGNEMLLVWNMYSGKFESAPILFIDSDPLNGYKVVNLHFSDGTSVKVIGEHGFWDYDFNRYIYLDENADSYIGHRFAKIGAEANGNLVQSCVTLTGVTVTQEETTAWSPVTEKHLCYYVNGMLSMPGGITGLFNIFEVDPETMTIDRNAFAADIETYGLFTYEEFYELYQIPEEAFDALNGKYLKVAIGKNLITYERIGMLVERYSQFF